MVKRVRSFLVMKVQIIGSVFLKTTEAGLEYPAPMSGITYMNQSGRYLKVHCILEYQENIYLGRVFFHDYDVIVLK